MLSRLNAPNEVSILPLGLGNHYTSNSQHLVPPGRRRFPYNHSISSTSKSSEGHIGDPNAPEANMSFREQNEYFGPDVLVIIGLVMASLGAILTLVSFYCEFKHPAIQATMAGIGPSLVGIGMLFCVLRLFFCTFCISKTCCECIADCFRFLVVRCSCSKSFRKHSKKKIHPLHVKDNPNSMVNGHVTTKPTSIHLVDKHKANHDGGRDSHRAFNSHNHGSLWIKDVSSAPGQQAIEMMSLPVRMEPITEEQRTLSSEEDQNEIQEVRVDSITSDELKNQEEADLKDEVDLLDKLKSERIGSSSSNDILDHNINELVLKKGRY